MNQEVSAIFEELNMLSNVLTYDVSLKTKDTSLKFKQLSTKQFNRILSTLVDTSSTEANDFNSCMCEILADNIVDKNFNIKDLCFLDYLKIVFETRRQCVSNNLNIVFNSDDIETYNLKDGYTTISLDKHLAKQIQEIQLSQVVNEKNVQVVLNVPTISKIIKIEKALKSKTTELATDLVKKLFVKELAKFIDVVIVNDKQITFDKMDVNSFLDLINNIPAFVINEVIKKMESMKAVITELSTIEITCEDNNGEVVTFLKEIPVNGNLFNF